MTTTNHLRLPNATTAQYNCPFGSTVADGIDYIGLLCPDYKKAQNAREKAARLLASIMSVAVFPCALGADMCYLAAAGTYEKMRACLAQEPSEGLYRNLQAKKCWQLFKKCFRGLCAAPQGICQTDFVSFNFLNPARSHDIIRPYGKLYTSHATIIYPETEQEVADCILKAKQNHQKISIRGAGYSQGKQTMPPSDGDVCIDLKKFKKIEIAPETKVATVGAGVRWSELQAEADKVGLAILVQQASYVFNIAASLAGPNCHGWDHRFGSLGNTVLSIRLMKSDGDIVTVGPEDELFKLVLGSYGLFGIILEVTLQLTENTKLFCWGKKVEIDEYVNYYRRVIQPNPQHHMHLYRLSISSQGLLKEGYAQNYSVFDPEKDRTQNLVDEVPEGSLKDRIMLQFARNFPVLVDWWWKKEKAEILTTKVAMRNEIMRPPIEAAFNNHSVSCAEWLQEYFLPAEHLAAFIHYLGGVLTKNSVKLFNCSVRPVIQDKLSAMGYACEGERFAVVLFFTQYLQQDHINITRDWVREVVDKVIEMGGTYYLPYMHFPTREQFRKCYPTYEYILEKKKDYDPDSIFENGLYIEYIKR